MLSQDVAEQQEESRSGWAAKDTISLILSESIAEGLAKFLNSAILPAVVLEFCFLQPLEF